MSQITIQDLSFTYEGDHIPVFQHLDLQLDTRWKLGLVGRNGWGKTTLLRLLEGSLSGSGALTRPDRPVYFPRPVDEPERATWAVFAWLTTVSARPFIPTSMDISVISPLLIPFVRSGQAILLLFSKKS